MYFNVDNDRIWTQSCWCSSCVEATRIFRGHLTDCVLGRSTWIRTVRWKLLFIYSKCGYAEHKYVLIWNLQRTCIHLPSIWSYVWSSKLLNGFRLNLVLNVYTKNRASFIFLLYQFNTTPNFQDDFFKTPYFTKQTYESKTMRCWRSLVRMVKIKS